jgi:hypothetical protein
MPVLFFRFPAEAIDQSLQNRLDAAWSGIRNGFAAAAIDANLFVLGADPPAVAGFPRRMEVFFQLVVFLNVWHGFKYYCDTAGK